MLTDEVLKFLEEKKGEYASGEELANKLSVSRTAVWKAIRTLKEQDFPIDSVKNRGYRLIGDRLCEWGIRKYMKIGAYKFYIYDELTSTNDVAKKMAALGEPEGAVVIARSQTAGRGRLGRKFYSPKGCGAYFSIIVRPKRLERLLTVMAANAVAGGIEDAGGKKTAVKWVNDVYVDGKKCCGILTEAVSDMESGGIEYAVIGIGINVCKPKKGYGELKAIAASALDGVEDGANKVVAAVLDRFFEMYTLCEKDEIVCEYKKRSFLIGKQVFVVKDGHSAPAQVLDIDDDCALVVKYLETLETETLSAGEVQIKLQ